MDLKLNRMQKGIEAAVGSLEKRIGKFGEKISERVKMIEERNREEETKRNREEETKRNSETKER